MAAEYVIFRSSNTFATFCANRSLSVSFCGHIRRASSLLRRDSVRDSQAHCRSMFRRSYCISTTIKAQKELQAVENIHSAVCVERLPFITPDKTDLKKRYEHLQDQFELEKSALSQDEVEVRKVKERKKKLTERDEDENLEIAQFEEQRKEFEEEQDEEYRQFQPASRETDADRNNDLKSIHRRLQHTLILLLKSKDTQWVMPHSIIQDKETLREAADRRLKQACGSEMNVKFISNAPAGVMRTNSASIVNKVFFYKACFVGGTVHLGAEYQDYVWVTRDEMKDFLKPDYYKNVSRFVR